MSSTGIVDSKTIAQPSTHRLPHRVLGVAAVLLCLFGVSESIAAIVRLYLPHEPATGIKALFEYPSWGVAHFLPGLLFMTLVPIQLWPRFRNRHRVFHRWSGRVLVAAGTVLGVSGVAFPFFMSQRPFSERVAMSAFFTFFLFALWNAFGAARRRDFARHREWMIRWFAVGLSITTQRILLPIFIVTVGVRDERAFWEIFVTAAWLATAIQVLIAEWWISTTRSRVIGMKAT